MTTLFLTLAGALQLAASASISPACGETEQAQKLASLIMSHESQQRTELVCNELLAKVAAQRAMDLIDGPQPEDLTPNQYLIENGFRFPTFYPPQGNQVQAVASEWETPEEAFEFLAKSFQHRDLVLGDGEFFSRQTQMGVGFYENEDKLTQYVVFIAEPWTKLKVVIKQEFTAPTTSTEVKCGKTWRSSTNDELRKVCRERFLKKKDEKD